MSHVKKVMISFFLTNKCNLDCVYCYANKGRTDHGYQTLPLDFAKDGIDYFFSNFDSRHIRFFGAGEPTCELDLMEKICIYAKNKTKEKVTSEIQTNGAFDRKTADWLAENMDITWVSFDGPPDIQDYFRPFHNNPQKTSEVLERNVKYLARNGKGFIGARVTINSKNISRQIEMIDYFYDLGISCIWTDPIFPSVGSFPVCRNCINPSGINLSTYVSNYCEAYEYAEKKSIFYGSFLTCNFDEKTNYHCRACLPVPHLTTDGYVSACDMALFGENANHMDLFIYGKWDKENRRIIFDKSKIQKLQQRSVENIKHCRDCVAAENCAGYCLGEVVNETGSLFGQKTRTCEAIRQLLTCVKTNKGCYSHLHP